MSESTLDSYLEKYAPLLSKKCTESLTPLHRPTDPPDPRLRELLRPCFEAQAHVATATAKLLKQQKTALLIAQCGVGKTQIALAAIHAHAAAKAYRCLVFCPGQLVKKWEREIKGVIPNASVSQLARWNDAVALSSRSARNAHNGGSFCVVSRDTAKLGPAWRASYGKKLRHRDAMNPAGWSHCCTRCGEDIDNEDGVLIAVERLEVKKHFCRHCKEPLWTWTDKPRKWAPATFIHKNLPKGYYDYLIVDEAHEEKSATSAQANAVGSLAASCRRVIALTGTLLGGYADHLRPLLFRLAPSSIVSDGFTWEEQMRFTERYGRIDTIIREKEGEGTQNRQSRGSVSKTRVCRPGIMPTLFGNHLMDKAIFLQLEEVAANLPSYSEEVVPITMSGEQAQAYTELEKDMRDACRQMAAKGDRRLLGAMLTSTLYYADAPFDWEPLGYKEKSAFITVHMPANLRKDVIYPKERALLDLCLAEKRSGRQAWVYLQLTEKHGLLSRLESLLAKHGLKVGVLRASVPPARREEWIAKNAPGLDVVLSHPRLVETGLDLFGAGYCFPTLVWYETGYGLFTLRQASRRSWRIGQTMPCRVVYLYYAGTMQTQAMALMGRKLVAAEAIDGKFSTEGLVACGDDDGLEMALARSLVERIEEDPTRTWQKIGASTGSGPRPAPLAEVEVLSPRLSRMPAAASALPPKHVILARLANIKERLRMKGVAV